MQHISKYLSPTQLFLLEWAMHDNRLRDVTDEELAAAKAAQEEFEACDESYYDGLYDGDSDSDEWFDDRDDDDPHDARWDDRCLGDDRYWGDDDSEYSPTDG